MRLRLPAGLVFAIALWALVPAHAQTLSDPTRPPNTPAAGAEDAGPAGTQLQSVLISQGRRLAIINGSTVALGGTVGEAKVVKITETEVVLQKGNETEVLRLYPGIDKQPVKRGPSRAHKSSQQGRSQ
jgi:MSHA biogenesis protein MshK